MNLIKLYITLLFILFINITFSQIRIGYTPEKILIDYSNCDIFTGHDNFGQKSLTILSKDVVLIYVFDKNNESIQNFILPENIKILTKYKNMFNSECKKWT